VAALNEFRDLDETFDHMRAKVKLDQLFGIAFARKEDSEAFDEDDDEASNTQEGASRVVDFGDGPAVFDLDEGESVETIQSQTPATSTQEFLQLARRSRSSLWTCPTRCSVKISRTTADHAWRGSGSSGPVTHAEKRSESSTTRWHVGGFIGGFSAQNSGAPVSSIYPVA
jgi:hypothetical protein